MARPAETAATPLAVPARLRAEDLPFMRQSSAAALQRPPPYTHAILWSVAAFVLAALVWAGVARIDEIAVGQGEVIPSSRVQMVQNLEGGIVSEISVKAGDVVEKGQIVMRLDDVRFAANYNEGAAKEQALRVRIARLDAEVNGTAFAPPADLARDNADLVRQEGALFESRRRELESNLAILREQAQQHDQQFKEQKARADQLDESVALASRELALTRPLASGGAVSEVEVLRLERETSNLKAERDSTRLALPRLEAASREVRQKMDGFTTQFKADAAHLLSEAQEQYAALAAANVGLEDRVARTQVRAPMAGVVKQVKVNTVGGVIQPGIELMEIVPIEDSMVIEARVRPADIAFLRVGQDATVKLSAYDFSIYGGFPAVVEQISADTLALEQPDRRVQSFYVVRVRTLSNRLRGWEGPVRILPGMEATVDVRTGRRTVLEYLLKPIIKTRTQALRER